MRLVRVRGLLNDIASRYVDELAALDPLLATYIGVKGHDHRLPDLSPAGPAAIADLNRRTLAEVRARADDDTGADEARHGSHPEVGVMIERLSVALERHDAGLDDVDLNVVASPAQSLREIFDLMDRSTPEGWEAIADRLAAVPDAVAGLIERYRRAAATGRVAAQRQVAGVATQCRRWAGQEGTPSFFTTLAAGAPAAVDLTGPAEAATNAYASLAAFLTDELAPLAPLADAVGRERYELESRTYLGASIDPEETYHWGWDELGRILDERRRVVESIAGPGASYRDAVAVLDADPARQLHGTEALRDWMQELSDRTIADLDGVHFDIAPELRRLECKIAPPGGNAVMYYTAPTEDWNRPGAMWWSVPAGQSEFTTWRDTTTVFHEGVPGHHLQVGQAVLRRDRLNRFQRLLCWVSGHGEGWALYAERLMDELGHLSDPGDRLGMLGGQGLRAARVVVDIGAHLELPIPKDNPMGFEPGEQWDADRMLTLLRLSCDESEAMLRDEVNRYLGWPGQAISYKVGERVWLAARDEARRRLGADFDLKSFHMAALDLGSMGLDPLVEALRRISAAV